jgi:hypothetical protein
MKHNVYLCGNALRARTPTFTASFVRPAPFLSRVKKGVGDWGGEKVKKGIR